MIFDQIAHTPLSIPNSNQIPSTCTSERANEHTPVVSCESNSSFGWSFFLVLFRFLLLLLFECDTIKIYEKITDMIFSLPSFFLIFTAGFALLLLLAAAANVGVAIIDR